MMHGVLGSQQGGEDIKGKPHKLQKPTGLVCHEYGIGARVWSAVSHLEQLNPHDGGEGADQGVVGADVAGGNDGEVGGQPLPRASGEARAQQDPRHQDGHWLRWHNMRCQELNCSNFV